MLPPANQTVLLPFSMLLASLPRLFARCALTLAAALTVTTTALVAQSPSAADGFDPDVDGNVLVLVTQPDGKTLLGGQFSTVSGFPRNNLARLNSDGSLDQAFNPNANGVVRAILVQADNRIVIGGDFTSLQPNATGTVTTRNRIARLNAEGTVEAAFNPNLGGQLQPQVHALLLQANGQIVAGGTFTTAQPTGLATAATRNYLARFNADGTLDTAFNPNPNGIVLALANHVSNKIVVGGGFTTLQPAGESAATGRNRIVRLNPSGTVDTEFNPNADNGVTAITVQRDGKIVLGGFFTTLQPPGDFSAANRGHLGRLNVDGTLDSEFFPRAEGNVAAIALQPDGALLIGGTFSAVWGRGSASVARSNVARFNGDGSLDSGFNVTLNAAVDAVAFQGDGKVMLGGHFTRVVPQGATTAVVRNHLTRLNADGSIDTNFELDAGGRTLTSVTQADGKVVIGGTFTNVGGATHNYVARLNADGTIDATYNPDFNGRVYAMALQADGKVVMGGTFTTIGGETRNYIARLNPSGTIDSEFNPNLNGQVGVIVLQSDGRILVGGSFNSVQPIGSTTAFSRQNLIRLNTNGTLDTAFDPEPNAAVATILVQSDGKIVVGGSFTTVQPGGAPTTTTAANGTVSTTFSTATVTPRNHLVRFNADGTLETAFDPNLNAPVSALALQSDGKIIVAGSFTALNPTGAPSVTTTNADGTTTTTTVINRARLLRLNTDGSVDAAFDPNPNDNVLAVAIQSDQKILIGGPFTTLQPLKPTAATVFTLRKYAGRLNADGTVDATFNLDLNEQLGNRIDSIRIQSDGRVLIGGSFTSLQPAGTAARITRRTFARLAANGTVDTAFDPLAGGSTGAIVNAFAIQPDGKIIAVGSFGDLSGAKSTNIARFRPEGTPDSEFSNSLTTDGPVNAVVVRPNGAPVPSQASGFAWLNANGTLRTAFSTGATRLSGEVTAIAVQPDGRLLLGGAFANLSNSTGGNLVRFSATGAIDTSFNPSPNGTVTAIAVQADGRIVIVGSFTLVGGVARNRIARIDANGSVDVTYDPNASARINSLVLQSNGLAVVGGAFIAFTPNLTTTAVTRNYLARINVDGTVDSTYDPAPNSVVNALVLQGDGKVIVGGVFSTVQPNSGSTAFTRNSLARLNTDGTLDQNFDPNANSSVNALAALANGQIIVGGSFTTLQPNATGAVITRNNVARINSDGAVDLAYNPNANGAVTSLAIQPDGSVLVGGMFTTLQPNGIASAVARNHLARLVPDGALDLNFNPDINGTVSTVVSRPDGTALVGGKFDDLQLNGSMYLGGNFATIGGVPARNLASFNQNGSVNTTFQPRPDGAVNALLVLPDGRMLAGGAFTNIAGAARNRIARFNADGSLDAAFNPNAGGAISALAVQSDGKILVGGAFTTIGGQTRSNLARLNADGTVDAAFAPATTGAVTGLAAQVGDNRILVLMAGNGVRNVLARLNADGSPDASFTSANGGADVINGFTLQADGRILVAGTFTAIGGAPISRVARLNPNGAVDTSFNPAPNGRVTAIALQADGRVMIGGGFTNVGGLPRVGVARLAATSPATQVLGVAANRGTVMWNRGGTVGEISGVVFEQSPDRITWTRLGEGTRVAGSANWQLGGLNLPASGLFYVRARSLSPSTAGTSSSIYESAREFTFSSPLPVSSAASATPLAVGAGPGFDAISGIVPRAASSIVPGEGSVEIFVSSAALVPANARPSRLANLSTRGRVAADSPLILGFAIDGTEPRRVLLRAAGPALTAFGVTGALPTTRLQIYSASGALLAANEGWANSVDVAQTAAATGAFPLTVGSADSAAVLTLAPGNYTMQVVDPRGTASTGSGQAGGVALAEIYDAGTGVGSRLVNVSSRGAVGSGSNALISGFVIAGDVTQRLLLRGVGPGLAKFGTAATVVDPSIALFDAEGRELGANDNWVSSVPQISLAATGAGAFALDVGSKDAAVLANLPAGAYTIQVSAPGTGAVLLEIYEVR
ncbi:MAG: hypothetical protein EXS37_08000 [Opitutus sp.]|nr:hypothetical protein [Opitutus sp.]